MDFTDKTIIITGGTRGIGAAIVSAFCNARANIIVTGTKKTGIESIEVSDNQNNIQYHQLDYSSDESVKEFIHSVKKLDDIDVLINNAGVNKIESVTEISEDDWDWINAINLRGPFLLTQAVSKTMEKKNSGKIINIASIFGVVSKEKRAAYSSSKWGLIGFTKAAALDLAPFNVQVNAVSPGFVDTDLTRRIIGQENMKQLADSIPQGRLAKPDEIANVVLFLCSDLNTYITGQNIIVDGGFTSA
jgi:3-oxoacyl-[acyl-carrier protein] reductase